MTRALFIAIALMAMAGAALGQVPQLDDLLPSGDAAGTGKIVQYVVLLTVLSLAPSILIMVTSFTRIIIAFSFLRSALGMQSTPANLVVTSLALFLTFFVMAPVFDEAWKTGLSPMIERKIDERQAYDKITTPFRGFMLKQVREKDLAMFSQLAGGRGIETEPSGEVELRILVPAFMVSELRRGFEIGFLIALPFLIIDLIVATITMSMGMMMLPPTVISLPFKVLFFVLIDGWTMLTESLVKSFA
jgi:flagellar biosynthesis protein FliP